MTAHRAEASINKTTKHFGNNRLCLCWVPFTGTCLPREGRRQGPDGRPPVRVSAPRDGISNKLHSPTTHHPPSFFLYLFHNGPNESCQLFHKTLYTMLQNSYLIIFAGYLRISKERQTQAGKQRDTITENVLTRNSANPQKLRNPTSRNRWGNKCYGTNAFKLPNQP